MSSKLPKLLGPENSVSKQAIDLIITVQFLITFHLTYSFYCLITYFDFHTKRADFVKQTQDLKIHDWLYDLMFTNFWPKSWLWLDVVLTFQFSATYVQLGTPMQELFQHSGSNQTWLEASEVDPAICQITKTNIRRPKTPKVIHLKILSQSRATRSFKTRNPIRKPAIAPKKWAALDVVVPYPFHWNEV